MTTRLPDSFEQMSDSKYLRKEDCSPAGLTLTVARITQENIARPNEAPKLRWIVYWQNPEVKPMVLGATTRMQLKLATKADKPIDCIGKAVVAYNDPNIMFGEKMTGGIRLRAPEAPSPANDEVARLKAQLAAMQASGKTIPGVRPQSTIDDGDVPF